VNGKFNLKRIWWRYYIPILLFVGVFFVPQTRKFFFDTGWRWAYVLFLSFTLSFCLTPVCRWIAYRLNILDRPDGRKVHRKATPLLGSAAVFIGFSAAILINGIYSLKLGAILVGSAVLFVVGFVDDFKEVPAGFKLVVQVLCALLVVSYGIVLQVVPVGLGLLSSVSNVLLTVFWIVGITNAMNFFDGMDGLAAGLGAIIAFFLGVVAFQTGQPFLGWI
jgi:UDP-GlcNAc:undecaprenyl-phosphate GlcNAc-1-phosphate transferase